MKRYTHFFLLLFCAPLLAQWSEYVNPFIGTGGHGHTFPGPTTPFGMVQLSPDTRLEGWDGCSGYHFSDSIIYGFSHTHLSGTGVPDYCDILLMPSSGPSTFENYPNSINSYPSSFEKKNEKSKLGIYEVLLDKFKIKVKLTATVRTGLHEYYFPPNSSPWVIIDLAHRDKVIDAGFILKDKKQVSGYRISSGWAKEQSVYFSLKCSEKIASHEFSEDSLKLILHFKRPSNGKIFVQCAISPVDIEGAQNNLEAEWANFNFEKTYQKNTSGWDNMLSRIQITDTSKENLTIFYSALYHTLIQPNIFQDVDGRYRGMDKLNHQGDVKHPRYTVFSLWDTYRAAHPLYQLVYPEYNRDFILTFLGQFNECGRLPVWELAGNETYCMIGNHSIPVIANSYLKDPLQYSDTEKALMIHAIEETFDKGYSGVDYFTKNGFISANEQSESVSKTIENSLDFYAYQKILGDQESKYPSDLQFYYQNLFNPKSNFFQAKMNHQFIPSFDPREVNQHYTEANAWQYLFGAHHDIEGIISLMNNSDFMDPMDRQEEHYFPGGKFIKTLDSLFYSDSKMTGREQSDITGLIGQYAHGNEPSHHLAYLYNYCGAPHKTQELIHKICSSLYKNDPDGLCGNEDCGQMSAWYIFSALGFYPVNPINGVFDVGRPIFSNALISVPGKKPIVIHCDQNLGNKYVHHFNASHSIGEWQFELDYGDSLTFMMADHRIILSDKEQRQQRKAYLKNTSGINYTPLPFISKGERVFSDSTVIEFQEIFPGNIPIQYTFDLLQGPELFYFQPVTIDKESVLYFKTAQKDNWQVAEFKKRKKGRRVENITEYANQYSASGKNAIIDGLIGSEDFHDGFWQGFWGKNVEIIVAFDSLTEIHQLKLRTLSNQNSWIFSPKSVSFYRSNDGIDYTLVEKLEGKGIMMEQKDGIYPYATNAQFRTRYIKVEVINPGKLPDWHLGNGGDSWIFLDELLINEK